MSRAARGVFALVVGAVVWSTGAAAAGPGAGPWPQWRGPQRDGYVAEKAQWPEDLRGVAPLWRVDGLGPSYSGPIIVGERVFTTATLDEQDEVAEAYDAETGKRLWQARWAGSMKVPFFAAKNGSWIRATPACDGERLFVGGMRDTLVALGVEDGRELWRIDFAERFGTPVSAFGLVCSPVLDGEHLYIQAGPGVFKIVAASGEIVWRSVADSGGMMGGAFSSPVLTELAGQRQLIVQTRQDLCGIDPADGTVLWRELVPNFRGMNILTPTVVSRDRVFTSAYKSRSYCYEVKPESGGGMEVETAWEAKPQGYMSSPVLIDGSIYLHMSNRRFVCLDAASGAERWRTKSFGEYWSLVTNGRELLALDSGGELLLIAANPAAFELRDRYKLPSDDSWAHVAVAGDRIFVRELHALTALRWGRSSADGVAGE